MGNQLCMTVNVSHWKREQFEMQLRLHFLITSIRKSFPILLVLTLSTVVFPHWFDSISLIILQLFRLTTDCKVIFHLDPKHMKKTSALLSKMLWVHIGSSWGIYCACLSADKVNCSRQLFFFVYGAMTDCNLCKIHLRIFIHENESFYIEREIRFQGHELTNQPTDKLYHKRPTLNLLFKAKGEGPIFPIFIAS